MSTVFDVPCPECGRQMVVAAEGELQCPTCQLSYHARMGHLFPVGSESPPPHVPADRPTAATP